MKPTAAPPVRRRRAGRIATRPVSVPVPERRSSRAGRLAPLLWLLLALGSGGAHVGLFDLAVRLGLAHRTTPPPKQKLEVAVVRKAPPPPPEPAPEPPKPPEPPAPKKVLKRDKPAVKPPPAPAPPVESPAPPPPNAEAPKPSTAVSWLALR
jgi:outer membrane biosynthesis protein TonB